MSQKNKEYNTENFSNRLKRIISSDSDDKEERMYSIVRELEEKRMKVLRNKAEERISFSSYLLL